jgi:Tfp pilus assembly protein PilN
VTVLSSESSVLATGARLPRVNLLPPEIAEGQRLRKVQLGLAVGVGGCLALVGMLYVSASHSVTSAQTSLDTAQSTGRQLQGKISSLSNVTQKQAELQAAKSQRQVAMADEVRYSFLLKDLSLSIPSNVWLKSLSFAAPTTTPGAAAAAGATPAVATLTVGGVGFSHDDVALWLEALAGQQNAKGQKTYANPYFTNSTETLVGSRTTVNFTSTADLTISALSGRYLTSGS